MPDHASRAIIFGDLQKDPNRWHVLLIFEQPSRLASVRNQMWRLPGGKCCNIEALYCGCSNQPRETVVREIKEETGLEINPLEIVKRFTSLHRGTITYYFVACVVGGTLRTRIFGRRRIETPQWFPVTALPKNINIHHRETIYRTLERTRKLS